MRISSLAFGFMFFVSAANGAKIAVIDSGVDYKHKTLTSNMWTNPETKTVDADGTVYKDDTHGWNFAEKNNQIIDYKYLGTFSSDCTKIFDVQAKILQGQASQDEKDWYSAKKKDETFLKELSKFGNFVHGTHVSGISANAAPKANLIGMKLIPTEQPGSAATRLLNKFKAQYHAALDNEEERNPLAKLYLSFLAQQQGQMLAPVGKYTAAVNADVANGSFGASTTSVAPVIKQLLSSLLGAEPTEAELKEYSIFFVNEMVKSQKAFVDASPKTLFVFAAGNDGTNNDDLPTAPANIKADNTIAVAASLGDSAIATFSNFGSAMVEVAAPGVAILSTVPGDETLRMSGTSMAAPFVTNVAGVVKDSNPALTPAEVKKVLMETVDVKSFLQGKVKTSGIVNKDRAIKAALLSRDHSLTEAIRLSRVSVADAMVGDGPRPFLPEVLVTPLPNPFL